MKRTLMLLAIAAIGACADEPVGTPASETTREAGAGTEDPSPLAFRSDDGVAFLFATPAQSRAVLVAEDEYTEELESREIGIRAQDEGAGEWKDVAGLYAEDVLVWTEDQEDALRAALEAAAERIDAIDTLLPEEVLLVRAGNVVEGGLPHTRANAIVFAGIDLPEGEALGDLLLHELHHVMSRENRELHDQYFAELGFEPCELEEPDLLRKARLTNPDAPTNQHYAPLDIDGADGVVPFLYAARAFAGEGRLPDYFGFGLLPVTIDGGRCLPAAETPGELLEPQEVPEFFKLIGQNTSYVIHPEETLADNFVLWATDAENLPDPEIPEAVGGFWLALASE